jgi:DNA-binding transcriptional MocR family regulator
VSLYNQLASKVMSDITTQRLPTGSRLPALRNFARQHDVSMTTATRTYDHLQETGWIFSRPQSGFFVSNIHDSGHFPSLPAEASVRRNPSDYAPSKGYGSANSVFSPLGTSVLSPELLPETTLKRTIKRMTTRSTDSLFNYSDAQGLRPLRQALAQHFRNDYLAFSADELVITNSCLEAVRLAIETVTQEGNVIAVCSPCFSGLLDLLSALSRDIIEIPLTDQGIDLSLLEHQFSERNVTAALLSTSNINPTGMTLPNDQKRALAELAERYETPIVEDDIYLELSHGKTHPLPAKHWDTAGYILWCGSISKTLAPGLRTGWCLPGRFQTAYLKHHTQTSLGVNQLSQATINEFIQTGDYHAHVQHTRMRLQTQVNQYRHVMIKHLDDAATISVPTGGIVLWIRVPGLNAIELEQAASGHDIDIRQGGCFSTHSAYNDCFRVNCGWPLFDQNESTMAHTQLIKLCALVSEQLLNVSPE